jgi:hypothetical protein
MQVCQPGSTDRGSLLQVHGLCGVPVRCIADVVNAVITLCTAPLLVLWTDIVVLWTEPLLL